MFGRKPLSEPMLTYCQFDQANFTQNALISHDENAFENADAKMVAVLPQP